MAVEQASFESFDQFRARISLELEFARREVLQLAELEDDYRADGLVVETKYLLPSTNPLTKSQNQKRITFYPNCFELQDLPTSVRDVLQDIAGEQSDLEVMLLMDDVDSSDYDGDDFFNYGLLLRSRVPRFDKVAIGVSSLELSKPFIVTTETDELSEEQKEIMEEYGRLGRMIQGETQFRAILAEGTRWAERIIRKRIFPQVVTFTARVQSAIVVNEEEAASAKLFDFPWQKSG